MDKLSLESANWYNAATLMERVTSLPPEPGSAHLDEENAKLAEQRMERWKSQAPFSAGSRFAERLAADGLSEADLLYCLGEPVEDVQSRLANSQGWLEQISSAFSRPAPSIPLPLPEVVRNEQTSGFLNLIEPLLRSALDRVQSGAEALANSGSVPYDSATVAALLFATLPHRLLAMVSPTLVLELHVARLEGLLEGATAEGRFNSFVERLRQSDGALALLEEYPVLARQLVVHMENWANFSLEFLRHLASDWELLRATFAVDEDPGILVEICGDAGDSHRSGRSVQILKFNSGLQLVYKPRSLSVDVHFQELLAWLNERGDHPAFRTFKILDRATHGWTEFILQKSCTSEEEVRRFYQRQGAYLALLYAMEATDFHCENLIAAGEHPMLPDLEALFHPRVGETDLQKAEQLAGHTMNYSVLRVGLLPQRIWSDGESAGIDLSGLASLPGQLTPRAVPRWEGVGTDEMRLMRKRVEMPGSNNRPTLNGAEINVLDYGDAVVAGFTSVYSSLLKHRGDLLAGPLARFADDEVRAIMRATKTYGVLLRESFHPDTLRNALDRDRLFDHLSAIVEHCPYLAKVIAAERQDLQKGDVPIFTTRPNSRDVWSSANERIVDFFDEPGMGPVRRRLQELSDHDLAQQLWFIRASLATLSSAKDRVRQLLCKSTVPSASAEHETLLRAACRVGDRLEELALRGQEDMSWIGLTLAGEEDWILLPLGLDLYDGLPGVALYLAYLGEITQESRYTALSRGALSTVRRLVKDAKPEMLSIGGYSGWGGLIYCLTHIGKLWQQPDLLVEAENIVERIPALIERDEQFDIISGAAGCIGSLLALYRCFPSDRTLSAAVRCGEHLLAKVQPMEHGLGWLAKGVASKPLTGFSHGVAGIAWALLELYMVSSDERFRAAALKALEYERSLFSSAEGNWPDLRDCRASGGATEKDGAPCSMAWCHGAPGIGLARLLCQRHMDDSQIRSEIEVALRTTVGQGFGYNHCLCHGDVGNLELLLEAELTSAEPLNKSEVSRIAGAILASIDQHGWVCGNPMGVESPGLMTGLAGIGYELLRVAEPHRVPSVLALAAPNMKTSKVGSDDRVLAVAGVR